MKMQRTAKFNKTLLALSTALAICSTQLNAQERAIEETVVTALKGAAGTTLSDTPMGITAIEGAYLEYISATSISAIVERTPGASLVKGGARDSIIQIRGISASQGDALVGYYLDDFAYISLLGVSTPEIVPFDLERVEVLKGPQGTLYGAGSTGGTVRILSEKANTYDGFAGKVELGAHTIEGGDDGSTIAAMLNIPLVEDKLALRLTAHVRDQAGWLDYTEGAEDYNELDGENYKIKLGFTPNDRLRIDVGYQKYEIEASPILSDSNLEFTLPAGEDHPFTPLAVGIAQSVAAQGFQDGLGPLYPAFEASVLSQLDEIYTANVASLLTTTPGAVWDSVAGPAGTQPYDEGEYELYTTALTYDFDSVQFYATANQIEESSLGLSQTSLARDGLIGKELETTNVELRFASKNDGPFNWTAGYFYLDHEESFLLAAAIIPELDLDVPAGFVLIEFPGVPPIGVPSITSFTSLTLTDSAIESEQNAIFGEVHYGFTENVELTFGLRYFEDEREATERSGVAPIMAEQGLPNPWSETFDGFTGRVNLKVNWNDDLMSYASVSTAQRSGSANYGSTQAAEFVNRPAGFEPVAFTDEENLTAYEIGTKWFVNEAFYVDASIYYNDWEDIILEITELLIDPQSGALTAGTLRENAGDAESYGLEGSVNFVPIESITMTAGFNWLESEYSNPPEGSGVSSGDQIQSAPDWTGFAAIDYKTPFPLLEGSEFAAGIFATYMGERYAYGSGGETARTDGYERVDARVGLETASWSVFLHVKNLTDSDAQTFNATSFTAIEPFDVYMQPRTTELVLKYAF